MRVRGAVLASVAAVPIDNESPAGRKRRLAASRRGAKTVERAWKSERALTRRRYCELVGIHPNTLKRWERTGLLDPELVSVMGSPTRVFNEQDVDFGRRLIAVLREEPGRYSLSEAARRARS